MRSSRGPTGILGGRRSGGRAGGPGNPVKSRLDPPPPPPHVGCRPENPDAHDTPRYGSSLAPPGAHLTHGRRPPQAPCSALSMAFTATACIPDNPTPPREDSPGHDDSAALAAGHDGGRPRRSHGGGRPSPRPPRSPPPPPDPAPPTPPPVLDRETALLLASDAALVRRPPATRCPRAGPATSRR